MTEKTNTPEPAPPSLLDVANLILTWWHSSDTPIPGHAVIDDSRYKASELLRDAAIREERKSARANHDAGLLIGQVDRLEREKEELRTALEPFANLYDDTIVRVGSGTSLGIDGRLTAGMVKAAKHVLAAHPETEGGTKS